MILATIVDIDITSTIPICTEDGEFSNIQNFFKFPIVDFFAGSLCKCQPEVHEQEWFKMKTLFTLWNWNYSWHYQIFIKSEKYRYWVKKISPSRSRSIVPNIADIDIEIDISLTPADPLCQRNNLPRGYFNGEIMSSW